MQLKLETLSACPVCRSESLRPLLLGRDYETGSGEYGIDVCASCGIALTNPRPLESELPKLYAARSTADFPNLDHGIAARLRMFAIDRYLRKQLRACTDPELPVLDFGCGDGALALGILRYARHHERAARVTAVDFHTDAPPTLSGREPQLRYLSYTAWRHTHERYAAVFLRHVLEHHPAPLLLLTELGRVLQPGGRLFIEVPNRRSVWARVFGAHYFGYYVPRHLLHFDRSSLDATLRRAGFRDRDVRLAHTPLLGRSLGYLTGRNIDNTGIFGLATYPLQIVADVLAHKSTTLRAIAGGHG